MAAKDNEIALPRYRPSGATRLAIIPAALAGLAVAAVIGVIYGVLSKLSPFVIADVFLVFALGFGVGVLARLVCQFAHCRNRWISLAVGIALGVIALTGSYWIDYTLDRRAATSHAALSTRDLGRKISFPSWVDSKKETGWVIKGGRINGPFVLIVWFFEAFFVLAFASVLGWQAGAEPYCEQCRAWPKSHKKSIKGHNADEFWSAARAGTPLAVLELPPPTPAREDVSLVLDGLICDKCRHGFLNVQEETVKLKDGKSQTVRKPLVQGVVLDARDCETFLGASPEATA